MSSNLVNVVALSTVVAVHVAKCVIPPHQTKTDKPPHGTANSKVFIGYVSHNADCLNNAETMWAEMPCSHRK